MSYSPKNPITHNYLRKKPSFKYLRIAALVIGFGGTSLTTWAVENVTSTATPTTANTPAPLNSKNCAGKYEQHKQDKTQRRTEMFQKIDTNKDGVVNLTEWLAFKPHNLWQRITGHKNDHHQRHHHQGQRGDLFKKVDTNTDGQISLSEAQANAPRMAEHFKDIDTDHNGQISQDERRAAFKAACAKSSS